MSKIKYRLVFDNLFNTYVLEHCTSETSGFDSLYICYTEKEGLEILDRLAHIGRNTVIKEVTYNE